MKRLLEERRLLEIKLRQVEISSKTAVHKEAKTDSSDVHAR
jgi:hypothetical protein